jgi:MinD-like ATPase involved in chromosome partitioning or flagellar assembly
MPAMIAVHSFRGGTGKSNSCANLAAILAQEGRRVAVVDTDIQSPGVHVIFGVDNAEVPHSLNDYLRGRCEIADAAQDVTPALDGDVTGRVFLIPSSIDPNQIAQVIRDGYDVGLLTEGFRRLIGDLSLDALIIDTHPGLNEETLLSIAMADVLAVILRPDEQDYEGTNVTVRVARRLGVPRMMLIVNKTPAVFDRENVRAEVEAAYGCDVAAVIPHSDEMMALSSRDIFSLRYPDHPVSDLYRSVAQALIG